MMHRALLLMLAAAILSGCADFPKPDPHARDFWAEKDRWSHSRPAGR